MSNQAHSSSNLVIAIKYHHENDFPYSSAAMLMHIAAVALQLCSFALTACPSLFEQFETVKLVSKCQVGLSFSPTLSSLVCFT